MYFRCDYGISNGQVQAQKGASVSEEVALFIL